MKEYGKMLRAGVLGLTITLGGTFFIVRMYHMQPREKLGKTVTVAIKQVVCYGVCLLSTNAVN
ncbi:hypothetical protein [Peribacillus frigoritolerans]|uniref:hypothetical protein n=1 Tax=Peribacillus frigoritolerans TaxID=450367 RepID=UPI003D2AB638